MFTENGTALNHALQESIKLSLLTYGLVNPGSGMADCTTRLNRTLEIVIARQAMNIAGRAGDSRRRARE